MNEISLLESGVAVASISAMVVIVIKFLKHLKNKDEVFTQVISNHLTHSMETHEKLVASNDKLVDAIGRLENKL